VVVGQEETAAGSATAGTDDCNLRACHLACVAFSAELDNGFMEEAVPMSPPG
jgi:hypothetical protein